jgi:NitT/TauT family transport system ATP-binding protein
MSTVSGPTPLISVEKLDKSFSGPDGRPIPVLEGITLEVAEGEFVALLGRSGSGKSTLLRCIAGLIAPTDGRVLFRGKPLTGTNRDTTMVFQTFALLPWLTVQGNVELGLEARGVAQDERAERALRAIDLVGLDGYESAYPKELSGGMRQRVGFARALVVEPAALLMDEPFSALDVLTSENLRGELLEIWEGRRFPTKTMVMVTHNIEEAVLLADRILVLGTNPGRIKADMRNPLPRPRARRTPDFDALVDQIYAMMTQRDVALTSAPARPNGEGSGTLSDTPLPQASVDGLSGLAEVLLARHDGVADLPDLADNLGLEVDDLLPLLDALLMLGFAELHGERLTLSAGGRIFAGASIQESKEIFARACLDRAPLVRTIYRALRGSLDGNLPAGFFTDVLRNHFGEEEAARQLDVAVNWGRYAELYAYDATRGQIIREDQGIGATLDDRPQAARRGSLHLYLGASPGSGKTFTMLKDGRALRDQGEDVVIGFADAHGRPRTTDAIGGLEVIPPVNGDLDLAAVLARKPAVVLADEYGRHAAAIRALRDAGIDVLSTVDVTDLERASAATPPPDGLAATPTVSDADLAEADEVRFIDNSPEALRKRLGHGNIYPADQVDHALSGPFQAANLAALREIGLRVVAETLTTPGAARPREPHDVLVAVTVPALAEELVQHGARLARRGSATCTVLALPRPVAALARPVGALPRPAGAPGGDSAAVTSAARDIGARVLVREGRDTAAVIAQAVRETGARHLVLAEPSARLLDRARLDRGLLDRARPDRGGRLDRRLGLAERLADQLPDVDLHILAGQPQLALTAADETADGEVQRPPRGAVRIYLGYAVGCGITTAMLEEAARRRSRGADVVVGAVDGRGREGVGALLEDLELVGEGSTLDTEAILARHPEVVCIDDLAAADPAVGSRLAAARRISAAGITVVATVHLASLRDSDAAPAGDTLDEGAVLALADEIEMVDAAPSVLIERVRRGEIVPEAQIEHALQTDYAPQNLAALREQAFRLLVEHADRARAGYDSEVQPCVLACVAPRPGMEAVIRRSAALAAQLAGDFLAAVVEPSPPPDGLASRARDRY